MDLSGGENTGLNTRVRAAQFLCFKRADWDGVGGGADPASCFLPSELERQFQVERGSGAGGWERTRLGSVRIVQKVWNSSLGSQRRGRTAQ